MLVTEIHLFGNDQTGYEDRALKSERQENTSGQIWIYVDRYTGRTEQVRWEACYYL